MSDLDSYGDVLSPRIREAWPVVGRATARLKGSLIGGTALTVYLRHRESFDLDFLVHDKFSGQPLYRKLKGLAESSGLSCDLRTAEPDSMHAMVNGIAVQVFSQPRSSNPDQFQQLHLPLIVDGMRVASLPDLFAMKLDVIMYRPKLRDYIDIAAIDKSGMYRIEDGLRFHIQRYGIQQSSTIPEQILRLFEHPGRLEPDRVFADAEQETLEYLNTRALEAHEVFGSWRESTDILTLRDDSEARYRLSAPTRRKACGAWMPKARAYCIAPPNHRGHHRSK